MTIAEFIDQQIAEAEAREVERLGTKRRLAERERLEAEDQDKGEES